MQKYRFCSAVDDPQQFSTNLKPQLLVIQLDIAYDIHVSVVHGMKEEY